MEGKDGIMFARMGGSEEVVTVGGNQMGWNGIVDLYDAHHLLRDGFSRHGTTAVRVSNVVAILSILVNRKNVWTELNCFLPAMRDT